MVNVPLLEAHRHEAPLLRVLTGWIHGHLELGDSLLGIDGLLGILHLHFGQHGLLLGRLELSEPVVLKGVLSCLDRRLLHNTLVKLHKA